MFLECFIITLIWNNTDTVEFIKKIVTIKTKWWRVSYYIDSDFLCASFLSEDNDISKTLSWMLHRVTFSFASLLASYGGKSFAMVVSGPIGESTRCKRGSGETRSFLSRLVLQGVFNFRTAREATGRAHGGVATPSFPWTMRVSDRRIASKHWHSEFSHGITLNRSNYRQQIGGCRYQSSLGRIHLLIDCLNQKNENIPGKILL